MKKIKHLLWFLLILCFNVCFSQVDLQSAAQECFKVNVFLKGNLLKTGSGFVLIKTYSTQNECIGITNEHVLEGGDKAIIEFDNESEEIDNYSYVSYKKDYVLFIIKTNRYKKGLSTKAKVENVKLGDEIFTVSSPKGLRNTVSTGIISAKRIENNINLFQFTAAVSPGSSGGALINNKGQLIGLISSQVTSGQNLNFALNFEEIKNDISLPNFEADFLLRPLKNLEEEKIKTDPVLKDINALINANNGSLAYNEMNANKSLVGQSFKLLLWKIDYEVTNKMYNNFIETTSLFYKKYGLSVIEIYLILFQNSIIANELSSIKYINLISALDRNFSNEDEIIKPFVLSTVGICKYKIKDYYSCISDLQKFSKYGELALEQNDVERNRLAPIQLYLAYLFIANSYFALNNYNLSAEYYLKLLNMPSLDDNYKCEKSVNLIVSLIRLNNLDKACYYYKKYLTKCNSVYSEEFKKDLGNACY